MGHDDAHPAADNEHALNLVDELGEVVDVLEEVRRVDLGDRLVIEGAKNLEHITHDVDRGPVQCVDPDEVRSAP